MRALKPFAVLMFVAGLGLAVWGLWIPAKAGLAQILLEQAWSANQDGAEDAKPWPWAETTPVAKLRWHGTEQIVLKGVHGGVLAFAPGWTPASAVPGAFGHTVISAHRDTHFSGLNELAVGDAIVLETPDGYQTIYRVTGTVVAAKDRLHFALEPGVRALSLVTCWPLDGVTPNPDDRYIVSAVAERRVASSDSI